jgi:peptidoglycan/LPS O-acetylase OafA/YrhL
MGNRVATTDWPEVTSTPGERNHWLDVCRSLAIILVMLSHGRHFLTPAWSDAAVFRIGGFLGVELFFVLSGFLIGSIAERSFRLANTGQSWIGTFLQRRWLRTLPNYYLFLALNALLIAASIAPGRIADLLPLALFAQNLAWPGPGVFGEAWSLAVEEVFYLIFPLCLLLLGKVVRSRQNVFITVTLLLLLAPLLARIGAVAYAAPAWDEGLRKVVVFRLDALMLGVLAGWLVHEHGLLEKASARWLALLATITIGAAVTLFFTLEKTLNSSFFARVWLFPLVSLGCAMMLLSGLRMASPWPLLGRAANYGARLSYALYLAHMPAFHLIMHFSGSAPPGDQSGAIARWVVFWGGSILIAALVERLVERPILAWRDRRIPR